MFIKIPFESEIEFKTNIFEITKMSLEHDFNVNDGAVLGNFYISGEYRTHEVSINKEPFKYTLPFTVELRDDIVKDTLEFNIEDFSYDIVDNNKLKVNIEYSLTAEVNCEEELFERVKDEDLEDELSLIDDFLEKENDLNDEENVQMVEEKEEGVEEKPQEKIKVREKEEVIDNPISKSTEMVAKEEPTLMEGNKEDKEKRITKEEEKTIMETIKSSDDTFVTYHIHIAKESESLETISSIYNVPSSIIQEYNNIDNLSAGDKVLIPKCDE